MQIAGAVLSILGLLQAVDLSYTLPAPPKLLLVNAGTEGDVLFVAVEELLNTGSLHPDQCENFCSYTYPTHTYPVVEHHEACRLGCQLIQLSESLKVCKHVCTKILSTEEEQYACHVGCTKLVAQQFKEDGLFTISITRENLFPIKELFKNFLWGKDNSVEQEREIEKLFFLSAHVDKETGLRSYPLSSDTLPAGLTSLLNHPAQLIYKSESVTFTEASFIPRPLLILMLLLFVLLCTLTTLVLLAKQVGFAGTESTEKQNHATDSSLKGPPCIHCLQFSTHTMESAYLPHLSEKYKTIPSPVTVILDSKTSL